MILTEMFCGFVTHVFTVDDNGTYTYISDQTTRHLYVKYMIEWKGFKPSVEVEKASIRTSDKMVIVEVTNELELYIKHKGYGN